TTIQGTRPCHIYSQASGSGCLRLSTNASGQRCIGANASLSLTSLPGCLARDNFNITDLQHCQAVKIALSLAHSLSSQSARDGLKHSSELSTNGCRTITSSPRMLSLPSPRHRIQSLRRRSSLPLQRSNHPMSLLGDTF